MKRMWQVLVAGSALSLAAWAQEPPAQEPVQNQPTPEPKAQPVPEPELFDEGLDDLLGGESIDPGQTGEASGSDPLKGWKGFFEVKPRVYFDDRGGQKNDEQLLIRGEFEFDFRFTDALAGYFRPRFFFDALDGDLERFEPYEVYLTFEGSDWDLRAGQFVENWGIVDTYNPIDVVSRRDLATDFLDPDRLGELGIRYRRFLGGNDAIGEPTVSLYVLPVWRETLFPTEDQRFAFDSGLAAFDPDSGFEPEGSERGFYAARFASTLSTAPVNADIQFLLSRGPERTPSVITNGAGDLVPAYFGASTLGVGFRAVPNQDVAGQFLSTLTLKAEVVYKQPYGFDNSPIAEPDDYLAYVFGLDREFHNVISEQDTLTLTVEYAGEEGADDPSATFRPFRNDFILRGLWQPNDFARSSVEARGIYDVDTDETIFEGIYERQLRSIHEDLKLTVQLQSFDPPGTGESLFDFFPNNTSLAIGLRWEF